VRVNDNIKLSYSDETGIQGVSTGPIAAEELLIATPEDLLITPLVWRGEVTADLGETEKLLLALLQEMKLGESSKFAPYISMLPRQYTTTNWFGEQEIGVLEGTYTLTLAKEERESAEQIIQTVRQHTSDHSPQEIIWGLSAITSRAFTIRRPGRKHLDMIPFLAPGSDLLNHKHSAKVGWKLDLEDKTPAAATVDKPTSDPYFQIYTLEPYDKAGVEVM
jgi:hypothetical protein